MEQSVIGDRAALDAALLRLRDIDTTGNSSAWTGAALEVFMQLTGDGPEEALKNLLADLMHWADRAGLGFDDALAQARNYHQDETGQIEGVD